MVDGSQPRLSAFVFVRLSFRVLSLAGLIVPMLALGCDKAKTDTQPPIEQAKAAPETAQAAPAWGDGSLRGTVTLKWGAPAPEGSTLQVRVYKGGEIVHQHDLSASGSGPWDFELEVPDTSGFADDQLFGVGATIVVPPKGESWYRGDPLTVQIWKSDIEQGPVDITISPINPAAVGDGPPKQ